MIPSIPIPIPIHSAVCSSARLALIVGIVLVGVELGGELEIVDESGGLVMLAGFG